LHHSLEKRNITDERQALKDALQVLEDELVKTKTTTNNGTYVYYLNTDDTEKPHLGDLSVFGVLRGLDGLPIHTEIMNEFAMIAQWYQQLKRVVEKDTSTTTTTTTN
jgi:hypothetical protein